jgi:tetratricopeptide (TPR) repeat protein
MGHIHRFNFQIDKAYEMYLSADRIAADADAEIVCAKILTNFSELTALGRPEESVSYAERAIMANSRFDNRIEVGKCQAAAAIAFSRLGDFDQAEKMAAEALATQRETGYRSGMIFAHGARCLVEDEKGDQAAARQALNEMENLSDALGVYRFYRAHIRYKLHDEEPTDGYLAQWLAPTTLTERMRDAFGLN